MDTQSGTLIVQREATSEIAPAAAVLIPLSGELDLAGAPDLREFFVSDEVLNALCVQVDLTQVTFLDSSCIGVLVSACKAVRARGGTFSLTCGEDMVRRVLQVAGLIDFFEVSDPAR